MLSNHYATFWHTCSLIVLSILFMGMNCCASTAQGIRHMAPLNPAFLDYQQHPHATRTASGHPLGYRPAPMRHSVSTTSRRVETRAFPSIYDLRTKTPARLSPIEDQGTSGCCWTFATCGSLESCLLPAVWSFSENNMKNNSGFDGDPNYAGGDFEMATAYLARWSGPVLTSQDPYSATSTTSSTFPPALHVQQVTWLPPRATGRSRDSSPPNGLSIIASVPWQWVSWPWRRAPWCDLPTMRTSL